MAARLPTHVFLALATMAGAVQMGGSLPALRSISPAMSRSARAAPPLLCSRPPRSSNPIIAAIDDVLDYLTNMGG